MRGSRFAYYMNKQVLILLLWAPSRAQFAALLIIFLPFNYSGFVVKLILNCNNLSSDLLMCNYYAASSRNPCFLKDSNKEILNRWLCFHKLFFYLYIDRFLPFVHLPPVEDTMAISRLKWTVQPGYRTTSALILILDILSGKSGSENKFILKTKDIKIEASQNNFLCHS